MLSLIRIFSYYSVFGILLFLSACQSLTQNEHPKKNSPLFEQEWNTLLNKLPLKLKEGLPSNLSVKIKNLNPSETDWVPPSCNGRQKKNKIRYGRFNQITKTLYLDTRLVERLIAQDKTELSCGHKTVYQLAQATVIHELVHAWDFNKNNALSSQKDFKKLGYWDSSGLWGWLKAKQKNTRPSRLADNYATKNPQEFLAVEMEYFLLDENYRCRQPSLHRYFSAYFKEGDLEYDPFPNSQIKCDLPLIAHYGEFPVVKTINPKRVYRIDYLVAAKGDDLVSGFGHSMFRLVMCAPARYSPLIEADIKETVYGPECLKDEAFHLVVSFRANVDDVILNYWKGLNGDYASRLFVLPYVQVKDEYTRDQLRAITLYPLELSAGQREQFVQRVAEQFWQYESDYKFISNNCAVESLELVKSSLLENDINKDRSLTPIGVLHDLQQSTLLTIDGVKNSFIPSKEKELKQILDIAYPEEFEQLRFNKKLKNYLIKTKASERAQWFSKSNPENISRIAALRALERKIKRIALRKLTLLARYNLYDENRDLLQALLSPDKMGFLQVEGYGVPFNEEIDYQETQQLAQINELKKEVIGWLKENEPEAWEDYQQIERNLKNLDILTLRQTVNN